MRMMLKNKKENYLDKIPMRNKALHWSKNEELVTIRVEHKGIYDKIAQKFFHKPRYSNIALDKFGSYVWKQIDGESSIFEIGKKVKAEFGEEAEPLYQRLSKYFYILREERYITFKKM